MGRASGFWLARNVARRGGTIPAPAFPLGGNGERGIKFLAAARLLLRLAVLAAIFDSTSGYSRFSGFIHSCRASIRTLNEPRWLGACWGPV